MNDELKTGVHSYLAEGRMQNLRDYVSRGRNLEKAPIEQLHGEWVASMRAWATDPQKNHNPRRDDIEAELALRGLEPPYEMVTDEIDTITRFAAGAMQHMDDAQKEKLNAEIIDFIVGEKSRGN